MEESHHSMEVVSVDQHATDRCIAARETFTDSLEQPVVRTSERVEGEDDTDFTSILLPVDSKERRFRPYSYQLPFSKRDPCWQMEAVG